MKESERLPASFFEATKMDAAFLLWILRCAQNDSTYSRWRPKQVAMCGAA